MKITPLFDRIVVQRIEIDEEHSLSSLIVPDTAKEKPVRGRVIAVGAGKVDKLGVRVPLDVEVGQTVLFGKFSGDEVTLDATEYLILRMEDVLGILTPGSDRFGYNPLPGKDDTDAR